MRLKINIGEADYIVRLKIKVGEAKIRVGEAQN